MRWTRDQAAELLVVAGVAATCAGIWLALGAGAALSVAGVWLVVLGVAVAATGRDSR